MLKSKLSRLALVGAGAAALMVTMAPSAQAVTDKTIKLPHDRGYMKFIDDGDVFKVCDTKADGYGVTGTLFVRNASGLVSVAATSTTAATRAATSRATTSASWPATRCGSAGTAAAVSPPSGSTSRTAPRG